MALRKDFGFFQGENVDLTLQLKTAPSAPVTTWTTLFSLWASITDTTPAFQVVPTLTDADLGVWNADIVKADTLALAPGTYQYFWERTNAGSEKVLASGDVEVKWKGSI